MSAIDFRKMIRAGLTARKMSIAELTRRVGCGQRAIYEFLSGRTEMRADLLARVLGALEIQLTSKG
jgi:transcriptional regulator with XRE-family HTH domain